ncbi:MAG: hypothetical protein J3Q66DRAFT_375031 [Benniella sp.]|nr:MAG: hypothetical protein J3Q66DRAFT_375031 [Benniella sp.]
MGSLLNYSARPRSCNERAIDLALGVCVTKTLVCVQNVDLTADGARWERSDFATSVDCNRAARDHHGKIELVIMYRSVVLDPSSRSVAPEKKRGPRRAPSSIENITHQDGLNSLKTITSQTFKINLSRTREKSLGIILLWHDTEEVLTMAVYRKRDSDESYQPVLTYNPSSTFVDGKALYVVGGYLDSGTITPQTFMIDLSVSWNADSPVYTELPIRNACYSCASAMSADGQNLFVFKDNEGLIFNLQSKQWSYVFTYNGAGRVAAATDPLSGKIYMPVATLGPGRLMLIVDLLNQSFDTDNEIPFWYWYKVAWNAHLNKLLFVTDFDMHTYSPETKKWTNFIRPPEFTATQDFCIVSSKSGSKVVLFGGYSSKLHATFGDIFILDIAALTWKKGAPIPGGGVRRSAACGLSNDYFIVWGGDTSATVDFVPPKNLTLVYDLRTDEWTSEYITPNVTTHPILPTDNEEASGVSKTAIIVGVVVALVIGLTAGGIFGYFAQQRRSKASSSVATNTGPLDNGRRRETVQVGSFGTRLEVRHPHACPQGIH